MKKNNKSVSNTASSLFETPVTLRVPFVSNNVSTRNSIPDPEVPSKATRRRFTTQYKLRILQEVDNCTSFGQIGVLLRREGLYSSNITTWHHQKERGSRGAEKRPNQRFVRRLYGINEPIRQHLIRKLLINQYSFLAA